MSPESIGRRRALLLGAAALASACARSPSGDQQSGKSRDQTVKIVNTAATFAATEQQLMKDRGYLKQQGLQPAFLSVTDGSKIIGALLSGEADICTASGFNQV